MKDMKKSKYLIFIYAFMTVGFLVLSLVISNIGGDSYSTLYGWISTLLPEDSPWGMVLYVLSAVISIVLPYFMGAGNFAIMISHEKYGDDIRKYGSKNAGMTNMMRVYGKTDGIFVALGDGLKTSAGIMLGRVLLGEFGAYLAALFAVLGHIAPVYYRFKGGKGVIASAIAMLVLNPLYFIVCFAAFCIIFFTTHWVSMGSVTAAFIYPAVVFMGEKIRTGSSPAATAMIFAAFVCLSVLIMHRTNLVRVYNGEESKVYLKRKKDKR